MALTRCALVTVGGVTRCRCGAPEEAEAWRKRCLNSLLKMKHPNCHGIYIYICVYVYIYTILDSVFLQYTSVIIVLFNHFISFSLRGIGHGVDDAPDDSNDPSGEG